MEYEEIIEGDIDDILFKEDDEEPLQDAEEFFELEIPGSGEIVYNEISFEELSFEELLQINDKDEAKRTTDLIKKYIGKKRDAKFMIVPSYNTLYELTHEYVTKVQPIIRYMLLRFKETEEINYYTRWSRILQHIDVDKITNQFTKLNSLNYTKSISYHKLQKIMEVNEYKVHSINLLIYALSPYKDKPIRQQTVGVPGEEFDELMDED